MNLAAAVDPQHFVRPVLRCKSSERIAEWVSRDVGGATEAGARLVE